MSSAGGPWDPRQQYRGFGAFPQPEPPRRKRRGWLIAASVLGAVVLIAAMAAVVVIGLREQRTAAVPAPPPSPEASAVRAGWQVVAVPKRGAVYDVPQDWEIDADPGAVHAVGPPDDAVTLTGVAHQQRGFCPGDDNSFRAMSGASARLGPDDAAVAEETLGTFISHAFTRGGVAPLVEQSPPERLQLTGGVPATRVNARVTLPAPTGCDARSVAVAVVATNNDGTSSLVFVGAADQDVPGGVSETTLHEVSTSLRPQ
ncbi:hypothetical protein EIL87_13380 [Saccharopolyspora rhizosphaerae]|uniref:DUF8017 domain-containing protein n=1 Tax=Saccharopolyspora rhizosphaerae TaxID=2492662 RepID=A0A426JSC0_9PSEU|nr:hypothetical protein [Saccharopolyspora rhizosphaerae]RRO16061.1 hypothetical protein EIL87_13380 [Saccharopolyspora rhizosphaerae]